MKIIFKTDNGEVKIDPNTVTQFTHVSLDRSLVEYQADQGYKSVVVNHDLLTVTQAILGQS